MRKKAEGTIQNKITIPKECPFCGAKLDPLIMKDYVHGGELLFAYIHPTEECILSGFKIYLREVEMWNQRR